VECYSQRRMRVAIRGQKHSSGYARFLCKLHPPRHFYVPAKLHYKARVNLNLRSSQLRDISMPLLHVNCHDVLLFSVKNTVYFCRWLRASQIKLLPQLLSILKIEAESFPATLVST
jgi:hypothetical protein